MRNLEKGLRLQVRKQKVSGKSSNTESARQLRRFRAMGNRGLVQICLAKGKNGEFEVRGD